MILAAVIAAFVFGMGPPQKAASASIQIKSTDSTNNIVRLLHAGGDTLTLKNIKVIVEQKEVDGTIDRMSLAQADTGTNEFKPGDTMEVTADGTAITLNNGVTDLTLTDVPLEQNPAGAVVLKSGSEVTVTLIDVPTGQQVGNVKAMVT